MAAIEKPRLSSVVRDVLEKQGLGVTVWHERDCISMVRALIHALTGNPSEFGAEAWACKSHEDCLQTADALYGGLEGGYLKMLNDEPSLHRNLEGQQSIGDVGLSKVPVERGRLGPVLCIVGPGYRAWTRFSSGIRVVPSPYCLWSVEPNLFR